MHNMYISSCLRGIALLLMSQTVVSMVILNSTYLEAMLEKYMEDDGEWWASRPRGKRAITESDMQLILDLHNKLRGQVYPQASNMEYMVWDTELERTAEAWAETCLWEHGPESLLPHIGQNLGAHWGRYRPPTFHVQAWYDEVRDYSYPYPQECNPYCPFRCSGPVCTHYTQLVWATSSRIGCAINLCYNMNVWGQIWPKAIYLVCNYSPKGNWWGHSPYKHGKPCSACPPSYGGGCRDNLCYKGMSPIQKKHLQHCTSVVSLAYKGYAVLLFLQQSSICRAALHYGVIDNEGGWLDVTRLGRKEYFIKSNKHGVQSLGKYQSANAFTVSKVTVKAITCETTVAQLCPFQKPVRHCPRLYCPRNCMQENPHLARVIGTQIYSDKSSICRAAVHAGVIQNDSGGYIDVMPVDRRRQYFASYQNGIFSERLQNPPGGKAFRAFAVV
uniref:Cysteine rich secretory protein LCCL domain containing 1 n=1 Tax=Scleropages formosus TaxID=113540 RepID=A0A8C9RWD0_SCLFO